MDVRDYTDPICPFDFSMWRKDAPVHSIPVDRVKEKEDDYFSRNDYAGAERHLKYWLTEAEAGNDVRGAFYIHNELMGIYRSSDRKEEALREAQTALSMTSLPVIGEESTAAATAYVNAATVYKVFDMAAEALPMYEKARIVYEQNIQPGDWKMGGLYNNMALALTDLARYDEALALYEKALQWMESVPDGAGNRAVTYLNMCDALMGRDASIVNDAGEPCSADDEEASLLVPAETDAKIEGWLDLAEACLNDPSLKRDGDYAVVAEKCVPSFEYYGREAFAAELDARVQAVYNREN